MALTDITNPTPESEDKALLHLLQLVSPGLPVGAYSYSEGLETWIAAHKIVDGVSLHAWLQHQLQYGSVRIDTAAMLRGYRAVVAGDRAGLCFWNHWLSATRETEELRQAAWQMGKSLADLLAAIAPTTQPWLDACESPRNFALVFGIAAATWGIDEHHATLGYLHAWSSNLIHAGVRLIPIGQTTAQKITYQLSSDIEKAAHAIAALPNDDLESCTWGLSLASMQHETLYSRLCRS
ncbi:urease accessory protein UreF [Geitlerinema sp. PCC 9228]|jgi:urease accessory protein|uniref:urease accessory protein UreF n=1 Tax=Geitlerinema sp. PCC 9228 TaxID=111611 RepID=UPI0008F9913D|nr:urease accessory protein UreF [Geitlerinema sp. PCC 9228]